jgi:hypothetical protein
VEGLLEGLVVEDVEVVLVEGVVLEFVGADGKVL